MDRAFFIARAEFFVFYTPRLLALIFRRRIIALFTFRAFQCYDISHVRIPYRKKFNLLR